jgi:hypothetical protein
MLRGIVEHGSDILGGGIPLLLCCRSGGVAKEDTNMAGVLLQDPMVRDEACAILWTKLMYVFNWFP